MISVFKLFKCFFPALQMAQNVSSGSTDQMAQNVSLGLYGTTQISFGFANWEF